jgi:putative phosphoribosyl transferase
MTLRKLFQDLTLRKLFQDRVDAGRKLAELLRPYADASPVVLALPRGGVPVAYEVARVLGAPLDVCIVRKIGAPIQPELAIGAVSEEGTVVTDPSTMDLVGVLTKTFERLVEEKKVEVADLVQRFRRGAPPIDVRGKTAILVDDGVATGSTARAALEAMRARGASTVVLATPVGAAKSLDDLARIADEVVCVYPEEAFYAVGLWYQDFHETSDREVLALLDASRTELEHAQRPPRMRSEPVPSAVSRDVTIPLRKGALQGTLTMPAGAMALVLFAHGSGSSRLSERNRAVAAELAREGLATLLFDLLTEEEAQVDARTGHLRFDIDLLADRLMTATEWALRQPNTSSLPIGYFGASTGAAAALVAAAQHPELVYAIVSRGGRPDLAGESLPLVEAPTLLLVGGDDNEVLALNREVLPRLWTENQLEIVSGATHLFEEPGALAHVARSAARWFIRHLAQPVRAVTA